MKTNVTKHFTITPFHKDNIRVIAFTLPLIVVTIYIHQNIPGHSFSNLGIFYYVLGDIKQQANTSVFSFLDFTSTGHPTNLPRPELLPFILFSGKLSRITGLSAAECYSLSLCLLLGFSYISTVYTLRYLKVNKNLSIIVPFFFLNSVFVLNQQGITPFYIGILLLPIGSLVTSISISYYFRGRYNHPLSRFLLLTLPIGASTLCFTFTSGYITVLHLAIDIALILGLSIKYLSLKQLTLAILPLLSFFLTVITSYFAYKSYIGNEYLPGSHQIDFIRAQGIDLITAIIPTHSYFLPNLIGYSVPIWPSLAFYGDGTNSAGNYIGLLPIIIIVTLISYLKNKRIRSLRDISYALLILSMFTCFILSLGPSLKINSTNHGFNEKHTVSYSDYLMKSEDALLKLPHSEIYNLPIINTMRATYRWHACTLFLLIIAASLLPNRTNINSSVKTVLSLFIVLYFYIELLPSNLSRRSAMGQNFYAAYDLFEFDVIKQGQPHIEKGELVYFHSPGNPYLANYLAPSFGVRCFNVGGDKLMAAAKNNWPTPVQNSYNKELSQDLVMNEFINIEADSIIVPKFDMRWDSYSWPPKMDYTYPFLTSKTTTDTFDVIELEYMYILRKNSKQTF